MQQDFTQILGATQQESLVPAGSKLPFEFLVETTKLLDVIMAIFPKARQATPSQKKKLRKDLNAKLYTKTRPGFYLEVNNSLHFAYVGQLGGHGTQHQWRLYCNESLRSQVEILTLGTTLTTSAPESSGNGNYTQEWGGLYLRSTAELQIAKALDQTGLLFFANARGRVGLQDTVVSNDQLTGRLEADFLIIYQGRCWSLEIDGSHHLEQGQTIRDYARDRVLLRSGVATIRFTAQDCLKSAAEVVLEILSIIQAD